MSDAAPRSDDWLELQRRYWDNWTDMNRRALGMADPKPATNAWEQGLDHWWKALSPAAPDSSRLLMDRLLEQGRAFFKLSETAASAAGLGGDGKTAWTRWLDELQRGFTEPLAATDQGYQRLLSFWEMPFDTWQRMMSSLSPLPGDMLRNMPHDQVRNNLDRVLSAPGLGYTREEQSQYQDLLRRSMDYQQALRDYSTFYNQLGFKAVERMRAYLQSVADSGKTIDSARTLYDNWVSCCEAAYAEEVATPEYAQIHGRLINAQMALKKRLSTMVDEYLGALNMPTRSELRTLQDRLQETRRDNQRLQRALHALERQVAALTDSAGGEEAPRPPARRKTAAKTPAE